MTIGYQSDVGAIKRIVLKHARDAFVDDSAIGRQWRPLGYAGPPDFERAVSEYDSLVSLLQRFEMDIAFLPQDPSTGLDSIYPRDAFIVCDKGVILCNMAKTERRDEPAAVESALGQVDLTLHGRVDGAGHIEGGDMVWIDEQTLAVGSGYRTNDAGIRQLRQLLGDCVTEVIVVPLPHWRGPQDVFHLMSILSPIDRDLALVYSPLLPVRFREALLSRGIELIDVPDDEFDTMACNVLAVAPRTCVMLPGNPSTRSRLEAAGAEVHEFEAREISFKGAGGPTCLTRPLLREYPAG
jgi:N-dimethylarginine dimethylaminohydrolase